MFSVEDTKEDKTVRKVYFSNLTQLMARHGISKTDIADIIKISYRQTLKKLSKEVRFDIDEAKKIVEFFRAKGEDKITVDVIFFDEPFSNESISA